MGRWLVVLMALSALGLALWTAQTRQVPFAATSATPPPEVPHQGAGGPPVAIPMHHTKPPPPSSPELGPERDAF